MPLDPLDRRLARLLAEDGRMPAGDLAKRLAVTAPTVRARIRNLLKEGLLRVAGLIDPEKCPELITVFIGINIQSFGKLGQQLDALAQLEQVQWAAVVTGRYDILAEVVIRGGMPELYQLTTRIIPGIGPVTRTETFVVMKSSRKWVFPPIPADTEDLSPDTEPLTDHEPERI
jgi:Lrp/AsnC family transcriptional regulator for asnA, asnC and gidA